MEGDRPVVALEDEAPGDLELSTEQLIASLKFPSRKKDPEVRQKKKEHKKILKELEKQLESITSEVEGALGNWDVIQDPLPLQYAPPSRLNPTRHELKIIR